MDIKKTPPQVVPYMPAIAGVFARTANRTSGYYYGVLGGSTHYGTVALVADKIYALPFLVLKEESFARIAINVTIAINPSAARLGIYLDNSNGAPGALLLDAGAVDTATTGVKSITINQLLPPGLYWLVILPSAAITVTGYSAHVDLIGIGSTTYISANSIYYSGQTYGELPANHPVISTTTISNVPAINLRRA